MELRQPIDMHRVVEIMRDRHGVDSAFIEHTGGGVWCIMAGERDANGYRKVIAGPGTWHNGEPGSVPPQPAYGDVEDFSVSPDGDDGETFTITVADLGFTSEEDIAAMIARVYNGEPMRPGVTMPTVSRCTGNGPEAWMVDPLGRPHGECGPENCGPSVIRSAWIQHYYARDLAWKAARALVLRKVGRAAASC